MITLKGKFSSLNSLYDIMGYFTNPIDRLNTDIIIMLYDNVNIQNPLIKHLK